MLIELFTSSLKLMTLLTNIHWSLFQLVRNKFKSFKWHIISIKFFFFFFNKKSFLKINMWWNLVYEADRYFYLSIVLMHLPQHLTTDMVFISQSTLCDWKRKFPWLTVPLLSFQFCMAFVRPTHFNGAQIFS